MISFFRNFFQSKIGLPIFIGFLILVALAFAASDITGSTFGGVSGGQRAALVGEDSIDTAELSSTAQSALTRAREQNPTITMPVFLADGGLDQVLDQLIDRYAIGAFAEKYGLRAGENLVNSEILQIPAFKGPTGEFDEEIFRQALERQRISDTILRRDFADGLLAQQLLLPALASPQMPRKVAQQYASLLQERRSGNIALIPSALFADEDAPGDDVLQAYYDENREQYLQPERRVLRVATFGAANVDANVEASEAEIAERFEANKEQYAESETRDITLFVVPTEPAAQALVEQIRSGAKSLEAAAAEAGFSTTQAEGVDRDRYQEIQSFAAAEAAFKAGRGEVADPARGPLGFVVARVDAIEVTPARTLAQASEEIAQQISAEKSAAALADLSARIEEAVDTGTALSEVAEEFDLELQTTPQLLADGRNFEDPRSQPNPALRSILDTAFALDESQPQLDEIVPGAQFIVYEVIEVNEAAAAPLEEIKERVSADYVRAQGSRLAREAADRVLEKVRGGESLASAISAEKDGLPPVDTVTLTRQQLLRETRGNVPPALVLLFSMAKGTTKVLEAPRDAGWILVDLDEIEVEALEEDSPLLDQTLAQLTPAVSGEYTQQLTKALREEVGVDINQGAVDAVRRALQGES